MDIEKRDDYLILKNNIDLALKESKAISIFSEKELDLAGTYIKLYKKVDKELEILRKSILEPINKEAKEINAFFKTTNQLYNPELNRLNSEVSDFLKEKREKEEEERKKEQAELEESILSEAELFEDETVLEDIPQVEIKRESISQMSNTLTTSRTKKWRVVDLELVPRKYLMLDEKMINQIRKDYDFEVRQQPISGIEMYYDESIRSK